MFRSEEFILKNKKYLECGGLYFNPDTSLMPLAEFNKKKLKVLVVFPSPATTKSVSSTLAALNDYVISECKDVFIDFCYFPTQSDLKLYDDAKLPYAIGNITHLDASHFDVVGFSISVLSEVITAPLMIKSFERCDKPISLTWSERKDLKFETQPLMFCGGITAVCGDSMFGNLGDGRVSYLDFSYLGSCEKLGVLFNRYIQSKDTGEFTRIKDDAQIYGYPEQDIYKEDKVKVNTIQDFINGQFDCRWIYHPQGYKVVFNDKNQVISNKKINSFCQDFVSPYYPHKLSDNLGIGRAIINANGDNCGVTQTQVSEGAMLKGSLIRTNKGIKKVEDLAPKEIGEEHIFNGPYVDTTSGPYAIAHGFNHGVKPLKVYTLESGIKIGLTDEHPVEQWNVNKGFYFKPIGDVKVGDYLIQNKSSVWGDSLMNKDQAEFLGRMLGDGSYNLYNDPRENRKPYHKMYLACAWDESKYCEELLNRANINFTKDEEQGRHCRFWILSTDKLGNRMDGEFWGYNEFYKNGVKYIPKSAYNLSKESTKAFLKGFHDADGCTSTKNGLSKVTFDSSNEEIIDFCQQLLISLGIYGKKHFYSKHRKEDKNLGFRDLNSNHWSIIISSEYFTRFNELGVNKVAVSKSLLSKESIPSDGIDINKYKTKTSALRTALRTALKRGKVTKHLAGLLGIIVPDVYFDKVVSIEKFEGEVYDLSVPKVEKLIAQGISIHNCSASGCCSFCSEGNYTGGWVEKPEQQILNEIMEGKKYSAGYKYKPYSFNCNYLTDYKGMLYAFKLRYPKVTFINMRLEELGRDIDALKMMKLIGSNRISAPIEGISPRIQNNLLNKCLSLESLDNFMNDMVHLKMTDIKVGGIFTGYEEDEDFQWICDFVDKLKERAKDENGNFPFRLKVTPLVSYQLTPCEYIERKSAKKSYKGERWLSDEWYEKFKQHEVYFKVNGFRYSTFIEQCIIDLGRSITPLIYNLVINKMLPVYSLRSVAFDEFVNALKKFINPNYFFEARNPDNYISLSHRIHIELMGSYIPRARRLYRAYKSGNIFSNPMDIRCLKTYDGAKTKCQSKCIENEPLKIYNDVEFDANGNLTGDFRLLKGCERCSTPDLRKMRLFRPTPQTKNSDDIQACPSLSKVQRIRFIIYRKSDYDVLNPNNTAHTFVAKLLQQSDKLLHSYHSIQCHSMFWQSESKLPYYVSGYQIVDTLWTDYVYDEVKSLISKVNSQMQSLSIQSCTEEMIDEKLELNDLNVYRFDSSLNYALFESSNYNFNHEIKVLKNELIETVVDKELLPPMFISKGKVVGYFVLPLKYNPLLYMQSFLSSKKISLNTIQNSCNFTNMLVVRNASNVCKCGKEKALVSMITGKYLPLGKSCLLKSLLMRELKLK